MDERRYDAAGVEQWVAGQASGTRFTRREFGRLAAAMSVAAGAVLTPAPGYADPTPEPIVKPLPPDLFTERGTNAEMRWEAMAGQGYLEPPDQFFVRNHTPHAVAGCGHAAANRSPVCCSHIWATTRHGPPEPCSHGTRPMNS
jgi:hypothetical protein